MKSQRSIQLLILLVLSLILNSTAMLLTRDNTQLSYKTLGFENAETSPLVLLIHGAGGDMHHYDDMIPKLVENGYRIITIDVRYHGLSQPSSQNQSVVFDFKDILNDIDQMLEQVMTKNYTATHNTTHTLYMGGLSMGGLITMLFAEEKAKSGYKWGNLELKGLVLMASAVPHMQIERPGWDAYRQRTATSEYLEWSKQAIIQSSVTAKGQNETQRALKLISDTALYECMVAIAKELPDPTDPPVKYQPVVHLPMLLIMPDLDPLTRPEMELLHKTNLENGISSQFIVIPDAGHMVILDKSESVAAEIVKFGTI